MEEIIPPLAALSVIMRLNSENAWRSTLENIVNYSKNKDIFNNLINSSFVPGPVSKPILPMASLLLSTFSLFI